MKVGPENNKKTKNNTVIHATLDMDSADLAEVVNGQTKELNFVRAALDAKDAIVKNTYEIVNTTSNAINSKVDQAAVAIPENIQGSRKFLFLSHGISSILCIIMAICSIPTMVSTKCYQFWIDEMWIWPTFFSISCAIGIYAHTIGKHFSVHNLINVPILIVYEGTIYFFVNGVAGRTTNGVSMIVFIICSSYHIITLVLALATEFRPFHWRNYFIVFGLELIFVAVGIFIDHTIWPLTFVLSILCMVNSIWAVHESLTFIGENYRASVNFKKNNFLQLTLSMMTNPIVLPLCYIITVIHLIRAKKLPNI